jgi:hypothetical protein
VQAPPDRIEYPPSLTLHGGNEAMLTFGLDAKGVLRHVDSVPNGKQCGCVCPACGESLIARQGAVLAHSFAHDSGADCRWAHETVLHHLAKYLIAQRAEFAVPEMNVSVERSAAGQVRVERLLPAQTIRPDSVSLEHWIFTLRPDVVLELGGRKLLVEIAVTHKVDHVKLAKLRELGHATVEIDLTRHRPATIEQLSAVLFGQDERKKWLVNPKADKLRRKLAEECEKLCQERQSEYEAQLERLAQERTLENQRLAAAMASHSKPTLQGKRYTVTGGALVLHQQPRNTVRITIEGDPGALCKVLERRSLTYGVEGYLMMKDDWARFLWEFGHQLCADRE